MSRVASPRDEVLARVHQAIQAAAPPPAIPRDYRAQTAADIEEFIQRLGEYGATTQRVTSDQLDTAVVTTLRNDGIRRLVVPDGIPEAWFAGAEPLRDTPPLDHHALDHADGVVTMCAIAIAQTGTIVLDAGSGMGRRALSLIPDYHLCVVRAEQIVGSVPEALAALDPTRPLTLFSGPSSTVDIEMVRVQGVHGPRRLHVIVAGR
ncbi:LUD domain-containing protein [Nonomuraea sp. NPDC049784]|uniref:LutC/YkgG family protein n=1 Tax=Nonomuraea sp. NPDC049784 TaxID=3154361 RepID=UPI0033C395DE